MEWFNNTIQYWHWMVFGLLLVASEAVVPSFVMLWFGASAIAVGLITAVVPLDFSIQLLIWACLSAFDLFLWFKFVHPRMKNRSLSGMSRDAQNILDHDQDYKATCRASMTMNALKSFISRHSPPGPLGPLFPTSPLGGKGIGIIDTPPYGSCLPGGDALQYDGGGAKAPPPPLASG